MRTVYTVRDVFGTPVAEHVRDETPEGKRMWWRLPGAASPGLVGLSTAELPLYGSEHLARLEPGHLLIVAEGERATEALWSLDVPAVGTVTGAAAIPGEASLAAVLPFDVVVWPDRDAPGARHMQRVARHLIERGVHPRQIAWGSRDGDDAADFVKRGGTRVLLTKMIENAYPCVLEQDPPESRSETHHARRIDISDRRERARSQLEAIVTARCGPPAKADSTSLWWCCPLHHEKTPSFKVHKREPFFVCYGCGARGDVFTFLLLDQGQRFPDALFDLAPPSVDSIDTVTLVRC